MIRWRQGADGPEPDVFEGHGDLVTLNHDEPGVVDLVADAATGRLANLSYRLRGSASWGNSGFPIPFEKSGNLDVLRRMREVLGPLILR